jgi:hypothetical protein
MKNAMPAPLLPLVVEGECVGLPENKPNIRAMIILGSL